MVGEKPIRSHTILPSETELGNTGIEQENCRCVRAICTIKERLKRDAVRRILTIFNCKIILYPELQGIFVVGYSYDG